MKWLLVRYSAIGDCVMSTHVASRIRRAEPESHIGFWVDSDCAPVIDVEGLCSTRYTINRKLWKEDRWSPSEWAKALKLFARARRHKYDFGLDLHGHFKTALCLRISKPKRRLAIRATDKYAKKLNPVFATPQNDLHFVDWSLLALQELASLHADSTPIMPQLVDELEKTKQWIHVTKPTISIATTTGKWDTKYPLERWQAVGNALAEVGFSVVFLGGTDGDSCEVEGTTDLIGKLTLSESMAVISSSHLHLAADTGMGHIAAAYGIPVVSVFGPTNPKMIRPYTDKGIVLQESKNVQDIQVQQIVEAAQNLYKLHGK